MPLSPPVPVFVRRLGRHHFAHLRAVAEGLELQSSAKRYLGVEHGHQAKTAHEQTVDLVRALARRRGHSSWRLVGLRVGLDPDSAQPTLAHFSAERGLDGWSESEVSEMYLEAYPPNRKAARGQRLRERQLALLRELERVAAEHPLASDLVSGWFDEASAAKLITAGLVTLAHLQARIHTGGRWYAALPGVGRTKAQRIAAHLATLLPGSAAPLKPVFALRLAHGLFAPTPEPQPAATALSERPPALAGQLPNVLTYPAQRPALPGALLAATNDQEAVDAWIAARAGSEKTVLVYRRDAVRLMLWLQYEKAGKTLRQMNANDCMDYMAFLQHIPTQWISRVRAEPGAPGWAPFRGPLSHASCRQSIVIVAALFGWLQAAQYLGANPWLLVNQKTGDDPGRNLLDTKALSEAAAAEVLRFVENQAPCPARARIRFILRFVQAVGLRSAELLQAQLGDLRLEPEGWVMQVHGKGARNRVCVVPGQALQALQDYLQARGLDSIETAPPDAPLLASALDPMSPIGYQALYEHVRSWISRAVSASALPCNERLKLAGATTHWLRHTFGTRAIAREVPLDVIQAQMGHASIQTTTAIYGRAPIQAARR